MRNRIFIIAEAGVNHNGSLALAEKLVDAAAEAGADAVKFQTFRADSLVTGLAPKAVYQVRTTGSSESQLAMLKRLELGNAEHRKLMERCRKRKVAFMSSPFDLASIDFLLKLGVGVLKIPSGEITNLPYLEKVGASGKKVIMSTGMANMREIGDALGVLKRSGAAREDVTILHCTTEYPAPMKDVNLLAMRTLAEKFKVRVGYSDHTEGIEVPVAAAALGAAVIEKHLTLDHALRGPDHKASLVPSRFKEMVLAVRNVALALGNGAKRPCSCELRNSLVIRKSLTAVRAIRKGELFSVSNIAPMRPAGGISPMLWHRVIGRPAPRRFMPGERVRL